MKKIFIAMLVAIVAFSSVVPSAMADNSEEVIIGVIGGALGGLLVGSIIGNNRHERVAQPEYIYVEPVPVRRCVYKKIRFYDNYYGRYFTQTRKVCY